MSNFEIIYFFFCVGSFTPNAIIAFCPYFRR